MKLVSFKVAKAIKEAGYPQDYKNAEDTYTNLNGGIWVKPTYIEVWLWLWREKHIALEVYVTSYDKWVAPLDVYLKYDERSDPEEAIIAAIEYMTENNLIK